MASHTDAFASTQSNVLSLSIPWSAGVLTVLIIGISYRYTRQQQHSKQQNLQSARPDHAQGITVTQLFVHPIKACRARPLPRLQCRYNLHSDLQFDRRWVIVGLDKNEVLTARTVPKMVLITPIINKLTQSLDVTFPVGSGSSDFSVSLSPSKEELASWTLLDGLKLFHLDNLDGYVCQSQRGHPDASVQLSRFLGLRCALVLKGPRRRAVDSTSRFPSLHDETSVLFHDGYPLLVAGEESLEEVERRTWDIAKSDSSDRVDARWKKDSLEMRRFRPNIVVRGAGSFAEDAWEQVEVGPKGHQLDLVSKCSRCQLPQVDPATGVPDAAIPTKTLATFRKGVDPSVPYKNCFGSNGVFRGRGVVSVGDVIRVVRTNDGSAPPAH
ncbi:hypothetical protein AURDEDRAFT_79208 [Auricularia subglabra TFB-10046 SS5]|nr:hypothetical protein AURDEDRAFT_79208 [Auricularia subglabra TFB-10046 SS5]